MGFEDESRRASGASPKSAVRRELLRAAGGLALGPFRAAIYFLRWAALRRAVAEDLRAQPELPAPGRESPSAELAHLAAGSRDRPLCVFISCAEPSGEEHALRLVEALREEMAGFGGREPRLVGLGGERLAALGVETLGDPVARAAMGTDALRSVSFYTALLEECARFFREERPDLVLPVDSPALHVPLAHLAKRYGLPTVHYVTPQYWAWAPWRVGGYRRAVDLALSILPFEPSWFRRHDVRCTHVGHPELDRLPPQAAAARATRREGSTLVLLPGSRASVIERNLPWMLLAAARLRLELPELEVVLPHDRPELGALLEQQIARAHAGAWVRLALGGLHEELARARIALSVSGTVLLDLLHHRVPAAVVYRIDSRLGELLAGRILTVPWFSSVNLLAGREVYPEACFRGEGPLEEIASHLLRCYNEAPFRESIRAELEAALVRLGPPGAARRAARAALELAAEVHG